MITLRNFSALSLLLATASLSGCITTDAAFGDFDHAPAHASDRYPISVVNGKAQVPACGNWTKDLTETKENRPYENLGCAIQHNIAAELDDPNTMTTPRASSVKSAEDAVGAVTRQQARVNTTTLPSNYTYKP